MNNAFDKYLKQSDIAEMIEFLQSNEDRIKHAMFIWEDENSNIRVCGLHNESYILGIGLIEIGKDVLHEMMSCDSENEDE